MKAFVSAALALALGCAPAAASGSIWNYSGKPFSTKGIVGADRLSAAFLVMNPVTSYLTGNPNVPREISVPNNNSLTQIRDGAHMIPQNLMYWNCSLVLRAILNVAETDIDWSQGWNVQGACRNPSTGDQYTMTSTAYSASGNWGGTSDSSSVVSGGVLSQSYNTSQAGTWSK